MHDPSVQPLRMGALEVGKNRIFMAPLTRGCAANDVRPQRAYGDLITASGSRCWHDPDEATRHQPRRAGLASARASGARNRPSLEGHQRAAVARR